jgi:predicted nucleotidyltransferase
MGLLEKLSAVKASRDFTKKKLDELRGAVEQLDTAGVNMIANGSYARKEASPESDFDYFLIFPRDASQAAIEEISPKVKDVVRSVIGKLPSDDGAFAAAIRCGDLTRDIGGSDDTNKNITRRILFLTEGFPVGDRALFDIQKRELIERYIQDTITKHQLALFFLNDVIRYWRTICVDFENKTFEKGKDWGVRNIKLVFSRRLLYFGGILIAAETANMSAEEKRAVFSKLIDLCPLERVVQVCGNGSILALEQYNHFLEQFMSKSLRASLSNVDRNRNSHTKEFRDLKKRGQEFAINLIALLQKTYPASHQIHRSLIM